MSEIIETIRKELRANSDEEIKLSSKRYFKESVTCYGMKSSTVEKIGKAHYKAIANLPKNEIFKLCEELWRSGYMEESFIACNWSYSVHKCYEASDFKIFENWVCNYVSNWASCDTLCNHTVGEFIEMYPEFVSQLKGWAKSENRWMKRAAAVTLIIPARKGLFLKDIFDIADTLHADKDDLVQKGYGWMLKAASQANPKDVFNYVMLKKNTMPRTALRYAIEKMAPEQRKKAMEK